MPPRFAYWTILIDNGPTAFRARDPQELLPTLAQLRRTNANVVMKWFARGRLWDSVEQEHEDFRRIKIQEKRNRDWRPGGDHKDPRARFDKEKRRRDKREHRADRSATARPQTSRPSTVGRTDRPWKPRPPLNRAWKPKAPTDRPWKPKAPSDRPWKPKAPSDRPWTPKAPTDRPWKPKPKGDRPWNKDANRRDWRNRPPKKKRDDE